MSGSFERVPAFEGVDNFRDYGGYAGAGGAGLATGRLYRSAHHARATDGDLARMESLGISVWVDLRRAGERARDPCRRHPEYAGKVIDNDLGDQGTAPHLAFLATGELTEQSAYAFMLSEYERLLFEERHIDLFRRYFQALADTDGAVLIHCAAGKDRTGLLAALTHHVAGVHPDDAMADYLLTNTASRIEERAPDIARSMAGAFGRPFEEGAVRRFMGVEPAYLEAAWRAAAERHGDLDGYLRHALGLDGEAREAIVRTLTRERQVTPAAGAPPRSD